MPKPQVDYNEQERLENLHMYDILDSEKEWQFDAIVEIAAYTFNAPVSFISLIDENRQWFKSKTGLSIEETPRELSFCTHAIQKPDEVMVIEDASKDSRFDKNPYVVGDPKIRFYAGAPLVSSEGYAIGTLCIVDHEPREFGQKERNILKRMSDQIQFLLDQKIHHKEIERVAMSSYYLNVAI